MIPKRPAPDLIRGGNRLSEKIMLKVSWIAAQAHRSAIRISAAPRNGAKNVDAPHVRGIVDL
jgi:hypothetical protein